MKTKRFLSILLSLVLVLGMFPGMSLTAFADDNTTTITPGSDDAKTGTGTMTITLKIKDAQTISASDVTATYGDTDKSVSASVTTPATGGGAISYAVKEGSGDYIDVDASTGALTIKKVPADGKAYVIVTAAATHDYAETTKEVTVNISTKAMTVSASDVTATADGQPHGITVNVTDPATGYTVKYGTEEGSYTLDASPTQTEVGEKTVYYQVTVDNYTTYTGSAKVTVSAKQTQTITAENVTAAYGDTGKSIEASTSGDGTLSYAVKSGDAVTVNETTGALTIVKAGSAIITVTASETATYTQATKDVTVTINKANAVAATVTANNRTYDGTAQPLVTVTGEPTGGTMQYALGTATEATEPYTTSIPAKTDAGTYYVYYKAIGDSNHTDSQEYTVEVTINKAAPDYTAPEDLTAECGTKVGDIELPEGFAWNSPDSVVMNIGDNEAVLTYTPADTDNYLIVDDIQVVVKGTGIHHAKISETCEDNGVAEYWEDGAGNKFSDENGKNALTDEQTVIEKLDHNFIHFIKWVWDGFNHAIAWLFCDNDPEHVETIDVPSKVDTVDEPTCTEDGYNYYVATIDVAGTIYTTVNIETVDQLGHKWKESEWNIDGTKASLTLVCENDPSHTKTVDAAVGVTVNEEGTLRTYTAKVTVDGVEYTKTWTEDITPDVPTPDVPTPDVPTPDVPTPDVPTPDVPTPDVPTPDVPTPDEPTPDKPTPDEPTPDKPTPDEPTPDKPTPDEPTPAKEIKGILGDVNNDGQVDSADALLILRNSVQLEEFDAVQKFLGDVNEDNENIDASDALAVLRYSVGIIDIEKIGTPVSKTVA